MAQAANITVNDRESTPVAHVFAPSSPIPNGGMVFAEAATIPKAERQLSIRVRKSNGRRYVRVVLTAPVLVTETVNGVAVPTVPRMSLIDATFRFDDTSTEQERANAVGMFANALATSQAVVNSTLVRTESIW